jgi:hypothetical protein
MHDQSLNEPPTHQFTTSPTTRTTLLPLCADTSLLDLKGDRHVWRIKGHFRTDISVFLVCWNDWSSISLLYHNSTSFWQQNRELEQSCPIKHDSLRIFLSRSPNCSDSAHDIPSKLPFEFSLHRHRRQKTQSIWSAALWIPAKQRNLLVQGIPEVGH